MNTLLFTTEYPPFKGGVANYYENLVKYWPDKDHLFVLNNNEGQLLKDWMWPKWLFAFFALRKSVKENKIDQVLVGQILPLGTVAFLLARIFGTRYSVILHGMDLEFAKKVGRKRFLAKKILEGADSIICNSSYVAGLANEFLGEDEIEKVAIVMPGIETKVNRLESAVSAIKLKHNLESKFVLFTLGRLVKRKGQDTVIEAMKKISKFKPNAWYYIAGTGPDEEYLKGLAKGMDNVCFLGQVTEDEKWAWLNAIDLFIMPARNIEGDVEGFGIVYLEAALSGKPVIAGRSGGIEDAVVHGETGILCDPLDVDEIAEAVEKLGLDWSLRNDYGANGLRRAVEEFGWDHQAEKVYYFINREV